MEQCSRRFQHQEGAELGLNGMDNLGELLINAVIGNKPKMLSGLNQKARSGAVKIGNYKFLQRRYENHRRTGKS